MNTEIILSAATDLTPATLFHIHRTNCSTACSLLSPTYHPMDVAGILQTTSAN